ncbi:MAG: Gfo/Idh/MocA family oxidoreductase [Phycisphaerae bacterium]|nr:Gfo/Idh/MocA family oxidoreductase [Phycisphaerae bacterium]
MQRRQFLKSAIATGTGLIILPSGSLLGASSPGNKLNIALIGVWGRAHAYTNSIKNENIVALCDVDANHLAEAAQRFPGAKLYKDWRKCLEQKDIDAVMIATPDFSHAFIANWAMNRGYHVYCEKPLANTVEEARVVRAKYLQNKHKLACQTGTQRHANPNFNRVRELIKDGAIGELSTVQAWGNRQIPKPGYLPAQGTPPSTLDYDLWIGPVPYHPYNPEYFTGGPGANCLKWNMYWDFGSGQVGDMGSHTIDLAWNAIDAGLPTSAEGEGDPFNPEVTPVKLKTTFDHPANDWRPAIKVYWYQGGAMPPSPKGYVDLNKIGHGVMFKGSQGWLVSDFSNRLILPRGESSDMSYYDRRGKDEMLPDVGDFIQEWITACKGDLKTSCDFKYGGDAIEQMLLGLVAYRVGKKLDYNGTTGRVTNSAEANALLGKEYRPGWTLEG